MNYNENKVKEGVAKCIGAQNYPIDAEKMTLNFKINYLLNQLKLNENVKANSVHISLNFHPSESGLDDEKLMRIADSYMQKIGFENQPYLVYRHHDAGHPHIHLVSIKVRGDGSRIDMHNIGRNQSETARKEIEKIFGLMPAEGRGQKKGNELQPIAVGKINYGKMQSKKAISTVLSEILPAYRYSSLAELNAVLRQYNVLADRGNQNSRVFKGGGLVYRILDANGKPVGVPIKASDLYNRPTLKFLEERFTDNEHKKRPHKARITNAIDMALAGKKIKLDQLVGHLERQGIHVSLRSNDKGLIYGITYIDHQTKCVFNGSDLGKSYSAKAIQERCQDKIVGQQSVAKPELSLPNGKKSVQQTDEAAKTDTPLMGDKGILDTLFQPENKSDYLPGPLKGKKKKRKKRNNNNNLQ